MEWQTLGAIVASMVGIIMFLLRLHKEAVITVIPREVDRIIQSNLEHSRGAKKRHRQSLKRMRAVELAVKRLKRKKCRDRASRKTVLDADREPVKKARSRKYPP